MPKSLYQQQRTNKKVAGNYNQPITQYTHSPSHLVHSPSLSPTAQFGTIASQNKIELLK
jgi:hypothetical protein